MLLGIDPVLTPDLLWSLAAMGHGDVLAIVDANFPSAAMGAAMGGRVHHLPGLPAARVLDAVLTLLPLDDFVPEPAATMQVVGDP
ncbi:MAG: ribose ABC transporter, partial [Gluconacetobacter diazotrophicus]|nr:ribose ABC transporter [Gluconacetobacter diazotrophicus]